MRREIFLAPLSFRVDGVIRPLMRRIGPVWNASWVGKKEVRRRGRPVERRTVRLYRCRRLGRAAGAGRSHRGKVRNAKPNQAQVQPMGVQTARTLTGRQPFSAAPAQMPIVKLEY